MSGTVAVEEPVRPDGLVRPSWRRLRVWAVLGLVVVLGGIVAATLATPASRPLDPDSVQPGGSRALARVLAGYGVTVEARRSLPADTAAAGRTAVLLTSPDDYSDAQLRALADRFGRLVLVAPGTRATAAVAPGVSPSANPAGSDRAGCDDANARAAGDVDLPGDARTYDAAPGAAQRCYGGALVVAQPVVLLGTDAVLRNDSLAHEGAAALAVDEITDGRQLTSVAWVLPGADAAGTGPASIWDLFPAGAYRAFIWLCVVGLLVVLWRARRLGRLVREPLPVVVRAAEIVEGHGRLYRRAGARDRAAAALRAATLDRLRTRLALPPGTPASAVAQLLSPRLGRPPADVTRVLAGRPPADDRELIRLAVELDALTQAVGAGHHGGAQ